MDRDGALSINLAMASRTMLLGVSKRSVAKRSTSRFISFGIRTLTSPESGLRFTCPVIPHCLPSSTIFVPQSIPCYPGTQKRLRIPVARCSRLCHLGLVNRPKKDQNLRVRVDSKTRATLESMATQLDLELSDITRRALREFIERQLTPKIQ